MRLPFTVDRGTFICVAAVGSSLVVGAASLYLYRLNRTLLREIAHLGEIVSDIRKEIFDLKSLCRRRPLGAASVNDEADVYYDFSDEGEEYDSFHIQDNYFNVEAEAEGEVLQQIDKLLENLSSQTNSLRSYQDIVKFKNKFFNNPEFLWRLAKAAHLYSEIVEEQGDKAQKQQLAYEALKHASSALALTDDSTDVHKWYAICLGSIGDYETVQNKIKNGFTFKEHTLTAMRLNPTDYSLHHMLGRWCMEVAMLSWIESKIAKAIYGAVPEATLEEARNHFLEAENLRGENVWHTNRLFVAKTYIGEGQYGKAIKWLDKASEGVNTDKQVQEEIQVLQMKYAGYRS